MTHYISNYLREIDIPNYKIILISYDIVIIFTSSWMNRIVDTFLNLPPGLTVDKHHHKALASQRFTEFHCILWAYYLFLNESTYLKVSSGTCVHPLSFPCRPLSGHGACMSMLLTPYCTSWPWLAIISYVTHSRGAGRVQW